MPHLIEWIIALPILGLMTTIGVQSITVLSQQHSQIANQIINQIDIDTFEMLLHQDMQKAASIEVHSDSLKITTIEQNTIRYTVETNQLKRIQNSTHDTLIENQNIRIQFRHTKPNCVQSSVLNQHDPKQTTIITAIGVNLP